MATKEGGDCYDYTLWEALRNKHKGDVMERREHSRLPWRWLADEGQFIIDVQGNIVAEIPCQGCNPKDGELIVRVVNQHTTLVEQRDLLVRAAKNVVERLQDLPRFLEKNDSQALATITAECLADLAVAIPADNALATVEQGGGA